MRKQWRYFRFENKRTRGESVSAVSVFRYFRFALLRLKFQYRFVFVRRILTFIFRVLINNQSISIKINVTSINIYSNKSLSFYLNASRRLCMVLPSRWIFRLMIFLVTCTRYLGILSAFPVDNYSIKFSFLRNHHHHHHHHHYYYFY